MPLFFVLSGLHLEAGVARGRRSFVINKLQTIAWPYFLWSYVEGGLKFLASPLANNPITPAALLAIPLVPIEHFWFLYVLFLCHILIAFLLPRRTVLIGFTLLGALVWYWFPSAAMVSRTLHFLPYVVIGLLAAPVIGRIAERPKAQVAMAAFAWLAFALLVFPAEHPDQPPGIIYVLAVLGSAGVIAVSMLVQGRNKMIGWIAYLGRLSMPIYLLHTMGSVAARSGLKAAGLTNPIPVLMIVTLAGIFLPILVYHLAAKFGIIRLLGFGAPPRSAA